MKATHAPVEAIRSDYPVSGDATARALANRPWQSRVNLWGKVEMHGILTSYDPLLEAECNCSNPYCQV